MHLISNGAGVAAGSIFFPGRGRSSAPGHSLADSLAARDRFREALALLDEAAIEYPEDPTPLLRGARVLRDDLGRYQEAVLWFTRALDRVPAGSREAEHIERELDQTRSHRQDDHPS